MDVHISSCHVAMDKIGVRGKGVDRTLEYRSDPVNSSP